MGVVTRDVREGRLFTAVFRFRAQRQWNAPKVTVLAIATASSTLRLPSKGTKIATPFLKAARIEVTRRRLCRTCIYGPEDSDSPSATEDESSEDQDESRFGNSE